MLGIMVDIIHNAVNVMIWFVIKRSVNEINRVLISTITKAIW